MNGPPLVHAVEGPFVYGYPVVVQRRSVDGGSRVCAAPLLIAEVEVDTSGRLTVASQPRPNPALLEDAKLSKEEAEELAGFAEGELTRGSSVGAVAEQLLRVLDIPWRQAIDPAALAEELKSGRADRHAQNVALLYTSAKNGGAAGNLIKDLKEIAGKGVARIPETALGALAHPFAPAESGAGHLLVASDRINEAQEAVIESAMTRRLTVAQGPPGTGKSQLVRALVETATAAGQSVLVASVNNGAVDGVVGKLHEGLVIRTGNKSEREKEPQRINALLRRHVGAEPLDSATPSAELRIAWREIQAARDELSRRWWLERDLADLAANRDDLGDLPDEEAALTRLVRRAGRGARSRLFGWWARWRLRRYVCRTPEDLRHLAERAADELTWRERREALGLLRDEGVSWRVLSDGKTSEISTRLTEACVQRRVNSGRQLLQARCNDLSKDNPKSWAGFAKLLATLPGWALTAHSARAVPPNPGLFDLVVVDEAAQCQIPAILPLLFRAKRALIIGDPQQLNPVITLNAREDAAQRRDAGVGDEWLEERRLTFTRHSVYDACATALGSSHLLDEHYRCHPKIIAVPNRHVYYDQLTVLTNPKMLKVTDGPAVLWVSVRGDVRRPPSGSAVNEAEAHAVATLVNQLRLEHPEEVGIGVVTPYSAQARLIDSKLDRRQGTVQVGTVHKFQGDEKDIMVISPVGAEGIVGGSRRWLVNQLNLWNVAITRAKSRLIVVGDATWWGGQEGVIKDLLDETGSAAERRGATDADPVHAALLGFPVAVKRDADLAGHRCDLLVEGEAGLVGMVIDDPRDEPDPRFLRRRLARIEVMSSEAPVRRVPVWRCLAEPEVVAAEMADAVR